MKNQKIKSLIGFILGIALCVCCFIYLRPWNKIVGGICLFVVGLITILYFIDLLPAKKRKERMMNELEKQLFNLTRQYKNKKINKKEYDQKRKELLGIKENKKVK